MSVTELKKYELQLCQASLSCYAYAVSSSRIEWHRFLKSEWSPSHYQTTDVRSDHMPSVVLRCWLGGGHTACQNRVVRCWHGYLLERGADLHMAQLMPLPLTVSCFSKIQIGFTFLVPAYPGSPGKRAVKRVCVCVCVMSDHCVP